MGSRRSDLSKAPASRAAAVQAEQAALLQKLWRALRTPRQPRPSRREAARALGVWQRRGRVTIDVGPLRCTFRVADAEEVFTRLCEDPRWPGFDLAQLIFMANVLPSAPPPRGRHARRSESSLHVRTGGAGVYVTLQQLVPYDPGLPAMILRHARQRHPDLVDSLRTRKGRWNLRELTAYVVEFGLKIDRRALGGGPSPTEDPERFYNLYVRGDMLRRARALLKRFAELPPVHAAFETLKGELEGTKSTL